MMTAVLLRRAARTAVFFWVCCGLAACATPLLSRGAKEPTMAELTYRAADMLSQQTQNVVTRDTPLQIGNIADITHPNAITPLGRTVGSQLAARFVQLGYTISANSYDEMSGGAPAAAMTPPPPGDPYGNAYAPAPASVSAVLTGQYAIAEDDVLINLRLLDTAGNKVLAAYDYSMPLTDDIEELAEVPGAKKGIFGF